jgi:hypothetical protein
MDALLIDTRILQIGEFGAECGVLGKGEDRDRAKCPAMPGTRLKPSRASCIMAFRSGPSVATA